tara:strand:- start:1999 stop:3255 length:1257 start_codon:yes stop_codon:yes gene_type:complete
MKKNKLRSLLSTSLNIIGYGLALLIGTNYYLSQNSNSKENDLIFYKKLVEEGYFGDINPYKSINSLKLNPTTYFGVPMSLKDREKINNSTFSLDINGYRSNPYIPKNENNKKCILVLGSSAAFGTGSSSNQYSIPAIMNKKLKEEYHIYNLGVPSWNSRQELISFINFLNKDTSKGCNSIDTISFTGTADIYNVINSKKSILFKENNSRKYLIGSPEQYSILEDNVKIARNYKSSISYKIKGLIENIFEISFSNIRNYVVKSLSNYNQKEIKKEEISRNYISRQIRSFKINQSLINIIARDNKGKHLIVLQPNLKNSIKTEEWWKYSNSEISKQLYNSCLKYLDLRSFLIDKQAKYLTEQGLRPLSMKESIKKGLFIKGTLKKHYYYDDAHLTDYGNELVAQKIIEKYLGNNKNQCIN